MRYIFFLIGILIVSCSPVSRLKLDHRLSNAEKEFSGHLGFSLYDPDKKETLYAYREHHYFTPASNTKIVTLLTALTVLGDSVPALCYQIEGDSLIFSGTGDPSFLNPSTGTNPDVLETLKRSGKQLFYSSGNFFSNHFGPGWAWDDYNFSFSAERSAFPLYGNVYSVTIDSIRYQPRITPAYFESRIRVSDSLIQRTGKVLRENFSNQTNFFITPSSRSSWTIPFKTSPQLEADLLSDTLNKRVTLVNTFLTREESTVLYSVPADTLYKVMMQQSDNFIAEQLLLMCSWMLTDSLKSETAIQFMQKNQLNNLPDKLIWVDGSGLSRYNLFTPQSVTALWEKLYNKVPRQRLFPLLAIGGKPGTLSEYFKSENPYLFGKTGTLSNNHCLSGFIITKSNRTLIFSFMANNYPGSTQSVRRQMEEILVQIREKL